jgi:hypothetical protein
MCYFGNMTLFIYILPLKMFAKILEYWKCTKKSNLNFLTGTNFSALNTDFKIIWFGTSVTWFLFFYVLPLKMFAEIFHPGQTRHLGILLFSDWHHCYWTETFHMVNCNSGSIFHKIIFINGKLIIKWRFLSLISFFFSNWSSQNKRKWQFIQFFFFWRPKLKIILKLKKWSRTFFHLWQKIRREGGKNGSLCFSFFFDRTWHVSNETFLGDYSVRQISLRRNP